MKAIPTEKLILGAAVHDYPHSGIPDLLPSDNLRFILDSQLLVAGLVVLVYLCRRARCVRFRRVRVSCALKRRYKRVNQALYH